MNPSFFLDVTSWSKPEHVLIGRNTGSIAHMYYMNSFYRIILYHHSYYVIIFWLYHTIYCIIFYYMMHCYLISFYIYNVDICVFQMSFSSFTHVEAGNWLRSGSFHSSGRPGLRGIAVNNGGIHGFQEQHVYMGGNPKIGVFPPKNWWFIMENPIKMDDLVVPLFFGNIKMYCIQLETVCCFVFQCFRLHGFTVYI